MTISVGAVVVTYGDQAALDQTLDCLNKQTVSPAQIVVVEAKPGDSTDQVIDNAQQQLNEPVADQEHFYWLLDEDTRPDPTALAELLRSVERSPSLALLSPKLLDAENPRFIKELGISLTRFGAVFSPAANQLDQAQHDSLTDILAVSSEAALIRTDLWQTLGGFDQRLTRRAAEIDFSIRARLHGFRVEVAPASKVLSHSPVVVNPREDRRTELQLKFAFLPALLLPLLWLALPLWGIARALYRVADKRLNLVWAELGTAFGAFLTPWKLFALHRMVDRRLLKQILSLRAGWAEVLAQRRQQEPVFEASTGAKSASIPALGWWLFAVTAASLAYWPSDVATIGGALAPLSDSWLRVFSHAGASWQATGFGAALPADPFKWVLAAVSALTFWQPSLAISALLLLAKPIAFWGAVRLFAQFTERAAVAIVAALVFAFSTPVALSLADGNIGAVISLAIAPWLVSSLLATVDDSRSSVSWQTNVGVAGLLLAAELASSPSSSPLWLIFGGALAIAHLRFTLRLLWVLVPTAVLFGPYILFASLGLGHPLLLLADPAATPGSPLSLWQAIFGLSANASIEPSSLLAQVVDLVPALLLIILFALALVRAKRPLATWLLLPWSSAVSLGWALSNTSVSSVTSSLNPSAVFGIGLLALLSVIVLGFNQKLGFFGGAVAVLTLLPLVVTSALPPTHPSSSTGKVLPAIVQAQWQSGQRLNVLKITGDETLLAELVNPDNLTLDGRSFGYILSASQRGSSPEAQSLSTITANLVAGSSVDIETQLAKLKIGYVLTPDSSSKIASALDSSAQLEAVGETKFGRLWRVPSSKSNLVSPVPTQSELWSVSKGIQFAVLVIFGLMALPTGGRTRKARDTSLDEGGANDAA